MKGDRKRKRVQFQPGNTSSVIGETATDSPEQDPPHPTGDQMRTERLDEEMYNLVTTPGKDSRTVTATDSEGTLAPIRILRPKATAASTHQQTENDAQGMRLIDIEKMVDMWNDVIGQHLAMARDCDMPVFAIDKEKKWGLAWAYSLKCTGCSYVSGTYKLYREVVTSKRGPKPAAVNLSVQAGLQDTPMGNTRTRLLLAAIDVPPPTRSSMQRSSNTVGNVITELNVVDMQSKLTEVREVNRRRGVSEAEINLSVDARYNSIQITSPQKPGQNASQAIGIACETTTERKYIVSGVFQNKLCWTGAWLRGKGMEVTCPGGHEGCTANTPEHKPWSEFDMGKAIGSDIALQGMLVKHVTTDGDSKSAMGIEAGLQMLHPMWNVTRLADPTHLGRSQFRRCNKATFSDGMFDGRTREARKRLQKVFSQDLKARSSLVFKELMKLYSGDVNKIKARLPKVLEATLRCYDGDCSMCRSHALVCGGGHSNSWWLRSMFLGVHKLASLNMDDNDRLIVQELLKMKLSEAALTLMKLNTDTQKCEAVNRSLSVSLPKNVNFSRNLPGRASSTIHRLNNSKGASMRAKVTSLGAAVSPRTLRSLQQMDREERYQRRYNASQAAKGRQLKRRGMKLRAHLHYRRANPDHHTDYEKGQLDSPVDHNYSQR